MSYGRHDMTSLEVARLDADETLFQKTVKAARVLTGKEDGPMETYNYRNTIQTNLRVIAERLQDSKARHPVLAPFIEPLSALTPEQFADPDTVAQYICDLPMPDVAQKKKAETATPPINPFAGLKDGPSCF